MDRYLCRPYFLPELFITIAILLCMSPEVYEPDYTKTPVFFVHGHGCSTRHWKPMMSCLIKAGYPREYLKAIQLSPNDGSNIDAAEQQIAPAIEEFLDSINEHLKKEHPSVKVKTKVDLISHSMGALSARWYTAKVHPDRVRIWLSLAGANHGTDALCGFSGEGADDMCPAYADGMEESLIQYRLNAAPWVPDIDETPYGIGQDSPGVESIRPDESRRILYLTIRIASDKWIKPEESATLDGSGGVRILFPRNAQAVETSPGNILITNQVSHDGVLKDHGTWSLVKTVLNAQDEH